MGLIQPCSHLRHSTVNSKATFPPVWPHNVCLGVGGTPRRSEKSIWPAEMLWTNAQGGVTVVFSAFQRKRTNPMTQAEAASPLLADLHEKRKARLARIQAASVEPPKPKIVPVPIAASPQEPVPESKRISSNNSFDIIFNEICEYFTVRKEDILSQRRLNYISHQRHMLAYMMYWLTDYTNPQIGIRMKRDHTTIGYAIKKIQSNLPLHRKEIEELEARIRPLLPKKK